MLKPELKAFANLAMRDPSGIYVTVRGNPDAPQKLFLLVGTHGQEIAGPLAMKKLLEADWRWLNVAMIVVWQDPRGYEEEGYGFLSAEGDASCWPPLWHNYVNRERYWVYLDENSAWGNMVIVPPRHQAMRQLMHELKPTFCLALHETVRSEVQRDLFWAGAGILLIESWPISITEQDAIVNPAGDPFDNLAGWALRFLWEWLRPSFGIPRWRRAAKVLASNEYYHLLTTIATRYEELGGVVLGKKWMRYLEAQGDLAVGLGRLMDRREHTASDWTTVTDYALKHYGCPGVSTETFQGPTLGLRGIDRRVGQQLTYVHSVLDVLNEDKS